MAFPSINGPQGAPSHQGPQGIIGMAADLRWRRREKKKRSKKKEKKKKEEKEEKSEGERWLSRVED